MGSNEGTSSGRGRFRLSLIVALALLPLILGSHWAVQGWRDKHINYPNRPSGYRQIVDTFGRPCNNASHAVWLKWTAPDDGVTYTVRFHRKLGGMGTEVISDKGGKSTNLDNDVFGHIINEHLARYVKSGVWGYACRYIRGTTKWSTHAWGIAVDVSARYEHCCGNYDSVVNYHHAPIWRHHRWYWGRHFGDPMHFQYADNY